MKKLLYHYCSVSTFRKILENKTLRFSDVMKSNDSLEIRFLWEQYYKQIEKQSTNESAVATLKFIMEQQLENTAFLTLCFSRKQDSLHMWNCYADEGINIGFDLGKLKKWIKLIRLHNDTDFPNAASIAELKNIKYYNSNKVSEYVENICKDAEFSTDGFDDIFKQAPFSKSDFFKDEQETRIMIPVFISDFKSNELDYVDKNGRNISSIKLQSITTEKFQHKMICDIPFDMSMISSITIGPNCSLTKADIAQLLFIDGFNLVDINKSCGSFR